jgi:hypothetical protein
MDAEEVAEELADLIVSLAAGEKDLPVSLAAAAYIATASMRKGGDIALGDTRRLDLSRGPLASA